VDPETHNLSEQATSGSGQQQASGSRPQTWIQRLTLYQSRPHRAVVSSRPQAAGRTRGSRDSQTIRAGHIGQSSAAGPRQQAPDSRPHTWTQRLTIYQSRPHRAVVSSGPQVTGRTRGSRDSPSIRAGAVFSSRPQAAGRTRGSRDSQSIRVGHIGQSSAAGLRQRAAHVDPETHPLSEQATSGSRQQQASGSRPHTWIQRLTIYQSRPHRAVVSSRPQAAGHTRGSRDSPSIRAGHIGQSSAAGLRQ